MQWFLKFSRLSWKDRLLLCRAYLLLTIIRLGLWLLPFEQLYKGLGKLHPLPKVPENLIDKNVIQKTVWAVDVSCKLMPGVVKCLARALATKVLLGQQGYPCDLKIGVAKNDAAKLEAHAWIELQGQVIIGQLKDLDRFKPLPALPKSWQTGG